LKKKKKHMSKKWVGSLFRRKKRKKKRGYPTLESKPKTISKRPSELPVYPSNKSRIKKPKYSQVLIRFIKRVIFGGTVLVSLWLGWIFFTLPDIESLNKFNKEPSILIKSEDGTIIGSFGDIYGDYIRFPDFPSSLVDAVIATEDRNFYYHFGVDPLGLMRAMAANVYAGRVVQGGSTITQQVAKNVFLTPERSMIRKVKEMLLAFKLEYRFTKQEIISIYLNRVYMGAGSFGVDAASKRYFGYSARELTLSQSAVLAGLLKAPSNYAPTSNPTLSRKRAEQVLVNMEDAGYLTEQQAVRARDDLNKAMKGRTRNTQSTLYFADWLMDQLPEYIGNVQQDIVVITTLRPQWQDIAEKSIAEIMDKESTALLASQAALVSMTPDGAVRAMIGGRSYANTQFNRATQSLRQPGSAFKLFVYLAALESGMTPESIVEDEPISIPIVGGTWQPKNYTNKYLGTITLNEALTNSVNTVAVQIAQSTGLNHVIGLARRMGVTSDMLAVPSIALGSTEVTLLELTTAYGHLAARGTGVRPYGIEQIQTTTGEVLYQRYGSGRGVVLRSGVVGMMNAMLMNVIDSGTGKAARIGRPAAGKTGTTSDYRDAWFMGYTPDLITGVWVGNDDNSAMKKVTGGMLPAKIWHNYMQAALAGTPASELPTDAGDAAPLPWLKGEEAAFPEPHDNAHAPNAPPADDEVKLGDSFWNTLMKDQ
jgi:penicillin-binding protein 1A